MRILITGITGFVGGHLVESLVADGGHELTGLSRAGQWPANLEHLQSSAAIFQADLLDPNAITNIIRETRPEWLFHLAGFANTGLSYKEPDRCWRDNLESTRSLYDAILRSDTRPRILYVSTGLVYGDPDSPNQPCDELTSLKPASPYAASKAAGDLLSYQYSRAYQLDVLRVRLFNQIGPRQSADYAIANFARQIAAIEAGTQPPEIETGDLSAERDITDVRDMTAAFSLLMKHGQRSEAYNAGRGQTYRMQDLLDKLLTMSKTNVRIRQKENTGRRGDTSVTRADSMKLQRSTGWMPKISIEQTLADILQDWRRGMAKPA